MSEVKGTGAGISRWLRHITVAVVVVIAAIAFWISFTALADLGALAIPRYQSWGLPVIVDGMIITGTLATVMMHGRESRRPRVYAWGILIGGAVLSVVANAAHGAIPADWVAPAAVKATIASIPPLGLLLMTHLLVMISRRVEEKKPRRRTVTKPVVAPLVAQPVSALAQVSSAPPSAAPRPVLGDRSGVVDSSAAVGEVSGEFEELARWVEEYEAGGGAARGLVRAYMQHAGVSESTARRRLRELDKHRGAEPTETADLPAAGERLRVVGLTRS